MAAANTYTFAEVAQRNGSKGQPVWVVYKNSVLDVTQYINEHPGGLEAILEEAGSDATKAIEDVGHSSDARAIMAKHKIGEIVESEQKYDADGKKKKRVVSAQPEKQNKSCISIITCGLLG